MAGEEGAGLLGGAGLGPVAEAVGGEGAGAGGGGGFGEEVVAGDDDDFVVGGEARGGALLR